MEGRRSLKIGQDDSDSSLSGRSSSPKGFFKGTGSFVKSTFAPHQEEKLAKRLSSFGRDMSHAFHRPVDIPQLTADMKRELQIQRDQALQRYLEGKGNPKNTYEEIISDQMSKKGLVIKSHLTTLKSNIETKKQQVEYEFSVMNKKNSDDEEVWD